MHHEIKNIYTTQMAKLRIAAAALLLGFASTIYAQNITGTVYNKETNKPVEYVNIGLIDNNIGTVCDDNGQYDIQIAETLDKATLRFSCIGYEPFDITVSDFKNQQSYDVFLQEKVIQLNEVLVLPKRYMQKTLGVKTEFRRIAAGFEKNKLGYELGIIMKTNKRMILQAININISYSTYDSIFYRLNVYEKVGKMQFDNILTQPYYVSIARCELKETIHIDVSHLNIASNKDLLVTLEHVKNLGENGYLYFCAAPGKRTFYRKTSHGDWETAPVGISISAEVLIEK